MLALPRRQEQAWVEALPRVRKRQRESPGPVRSLRQPALTSAPPVVAMNQKRFPAHLGFLRPHHRNRRRRHHPGAPFRQRRSWPLRLRCGGDDGRRGDHGAARANRRPLHRCLLHRSVGPRPESLPAAKRRSRRRWPRLRLQRRAVRGLEPDGPLPAVPTVAAVCGSTAIVQLLERMPGVVPAVHAAHGVDSKRRCDHDDRTGNRVRHRPTCRRAADERRDVRRCAASDERPGQGELPLAETQARVRI
jgi:hypothetical protein